MMRLNLKKAFLASVLGLSAGQAGAAIEITEWMYSGTNGEFVELYNTGPTAVDFTGWSFDDASRTAGSTSLSGFGVVAPREAILVIENTDVGAFRTAWNLPASVKIIGGNVNNLGRSDEINIYDNANLLVDRFTFGDQTFPGTVRTQNVSGNIPGAKFSLQTIDASITAATVGDVFGSYASAAGDIGSPGFVVPEPTSLVAVAGLLGLTRRRR